MNGKEVWMLRDTGCTQTLVHSSLIPKRALISGSTTVVCLADGTRRNLSMANCVIEFDSNMGEYTVGVVDTLPEEILLGNDITSKSVYALTRAQKKEQDCKSKEVLENTTRTGVQSKPIESSTQEETVRSNDDNLIDLPPSTLRELQKDEETLRPLFEKVEILSNVKREKPYFYLKDGLLLRDWLREGEDCKSTSGSKEM